MSRMMITASNTMDQLQKQLDIISSNIANSQTTGYKSKNVSFSELMYQQFNNQSGIENEVGRLTPGGIRQGSGARIGQVQTNLSQGAVTDTGRQLDFALTKADQFFKVLVPNGNTIQVQYTRDGAFYLSPMNNNEMALVTSDGYQVLDEQNNPIIINGNVSELTVNQSGQLSVVNTDGQTEQFTLGVVQVHNPNALMNTGNNLLAIPDAFAGQEADILTNLEGAGRQQVGIKQGALEQSNVDISVEMTNLMQTQRAYQFQSRAVTLSDQMQGLINGIR
ncbi:flagellar hook-basal body protein [Caldibacillus lycopersici]|uniref:Flagellar hook-basal body protein n=2 Tax=Perspicuibacillus lycopersici TaxID=1325689 RepID=A0AAE3IS98_9BACI|nr:flagellar hook-basal body protein [Perspicuibacillus lycopersici]